MIMAEAARLAAIEVLCPTAALQGVAPFATLAKALILDSRSASLQDLDPDKEYTPVVSLWSRSTTQKVRGDHADYANLETTGELEIVAELALRSTDDAGSPIADAMAGDDPEARLVLAALVAQIRYALFESDAGFLFRRFAAPLTFDTEAFGVPELGLRWHRITARMTFLLPPDEFQTSGGLPEPLRELVGRLPAGSYAVTMLAALASHFAPMARQSLESLVVADPDSRDPFASVEF